MTEKYEHAYEVYKIIMEDYRSESKAEDRKVACDLHRAKGLGKAANFIWQKIGKRQPLGSIVLRRK